MTTFLIPRSTPPCIPRRKWFVRAAVLMATIGLAGSQTSMAWAQSSDYPNRPVKLVVPFGPGGSDTLARVFAEKLGPLLKQQMVVENRPGAAAAIGTEYVSRALPDGYTLLFLGGGSLTPVLIKDLQLDPLKVLKPVIPLARGGMSVMVSASVPVTNMKELVEYSKRNPGKLNYAYSAASQMLSTEVLKSMTALDAIPIPYKGGTQVMTALMTNEVQVAVDVPLVYMGMINDGKIRVLAHGGQERSPSLPQVPTLAESGYPNLFFPVSFGVWAPINTPAPVVAQLNAAFNEVLKSTDIRQRLVQAAVVPTGGPADGHAKQVAMEQDLWANAARLTGFKPE